MTTSTLIGMENPNVSVMDNTTMSTSMLIGMENPNVSVMDNTTMSTSTLICMENPNASVMGNTTMASLIDGVPCSRVNPELMEFRRVVHILEWYFVPLMAIFGIVGNGISCLVFMATYMKHMSSSVYLAGLAVSDSLFLFIALIGWSDNIGIHLYHKHGWCNLFVYLSYVSSFLSVWFVVCFTVERHIAVCFPLRRQEWCTTNRARVLVISITVLALCIYTFSLWTSVVDEWHTRPYYCQVKRSYYELTNAITNADTIITLVLPTTIIVVCNIRIAHALARFFRQRPNDAQLSSSNLQMCALTINDQNAQPNSSSSSNHVHRSARSISIYSRYVQSTSSNRIHMKVTKMLLLISTTFLILNIPSHAMRFYNYITALRDPHYTPSHMFLLIQKLCGFLFYANFCINFLLYNLSGKAFRRALLRLGHLIKRKIRKVRRSCSKVYRSLRGPKKSTSVPNLRGNGDEILAFD